MSSSKPSISQFCAQNHFSTKSLKSSRLARCCKFIVVFALAITGISSQAASGNSLVKLSSQNLNLTSVTSGRACGWTKTMQPKYICYGESTVSDLIPQLGPAKEVFSLGDGFCGRDGTRTTCWDYSNELLKLKIPVEDLVGKSAPQHVRASSDHLCVYNPQTYFITCHSSPQRAYNDAKKEFDTFEMVPENWGPYKNLKDFKITDSEICVLDSAKLDCHNHSTPNQIKPKEGFTIRRQIKNPIAFSLTANSFCISDAIGVSCEIGYQSTTAESYNMPEEFNGATELYSNFGTVCARTANGLPLCVQAEYQRKFESAFPTDLQQRLRNPQLKIENLQISTIDSYHFALCATFRVGGVANNECYSSTGREQIPADSARSTRLALGSGVCAINSIGRILCSKTEKYKISPVFPTESPAQRHDSCIWTSRQVICEGEPVANSFDTIRKVYAENNSTTGHSCFVVEDHLGDHVQCYGFKPTWAEGPLPIFKGQPITFSATENFGCVGTSLDTTCTGKSLPGALQPQFNSIKKIQLSREFGCGLDHFGFACFGQLEASKTPPRPDLNVPDKLSGSGAVLDFEIGNLHICAVTASKSIECWGDNDTGQLDFPDGIFGFESLKVESSTSCASGQNGTYCWGRLTEDFQRASKKN